MAGKLAPVGRYESAEDAGSAQDALSRMGIESALVDEGMLRREWQPGVEGVRLLLVDPEDADLAEEILGHAGMRGLPLPNDDREAEVEPIETPKVCPACGSTDIRRIPRLIIGVVLEIMAIGIGAAAGDVFGIIVFFLTLSIAVWVLIENNWRCNECNHGWK